jgi:hypothetical protein
MRNTGQACHARTAGLATLIAVLVLLLNAGCNSDGARANLVGKWGLDVATMTHGRGLPPTEHAMVLTLVFRDDGSYQGSSQFTPDGPLNQQEGRYRLVGSRVYVTTDTLESELGEIRGGKIWMHEKYAPGVLILMRLP